VAKPASLANAIKCAANCQLKPSAVITSNPENDKYTRQQHHPGSVQGTSLLPRIGTHHIAAQRQPLCALSHHVTPTQQQLTSSLLRYVAAARERTEKASNNISKGGNIATGHMEACLCHSSPQVQGKLHSMNIPVLLLDADASTVLRCTGAVVKSTAVCWQHGPHISWHPAPRPDGN